MPELEELAAAMAQTQVDRNDEIYRRQREMKEELSSLVDLRSIREMGQWQLAVNSGLFGCAPRPNCASNSPRKKTRSYNPAAS